MPFPIITPFSAFTDVDAIFDSTSFAQVFQAARPMRLLANESSKIMYHPAETGILIADHSIVNPTEIEFPIVVSADDYDAVYNQIKNFFTNKTLLSVQSRLTVYDNMIIERMPHEESPDMFDAVSIILHLKEVLFVSSEPTFDPQNPEDTSTVLEGQKNAIAAPTSLSNGPITVTNPEIFQTTQGTQPITSGAITITNPQQFEIAAKGASGVW